MTGIAGFTGVHVSLYIVVLIIHFRLVVLMAGDAGELGIVSGIGMTFRTDVPCAGMLARIDRERFGIVFPVFCWFPPGIRRVALLAFGGKAE